jgi:hypothetical protein
MYTSSFSISFILMYGHMGLLFQICILNLNAVCYNTSIVKCITLYHVLHFTCLVVCWSTDAVLIEYRIFYNTHQ